MRKIFSLTALSLLLLSACTRDNIDRSGTEANSRMIYAHMADDESRVQLNDKLQTVWNADDYIITIGEDMYELWQFTGNTGDRSGSFTFVDSADPYDIDCGGYYYACYPYDMFVGVGAFQDNTPALFMYITDFQEYCSGSYDPISNIMIGESEDGNNFYFRNLLGYLRLSFTGDRVVKSITLSGNEDEPIAGTRYYDAMDISFSAWYDETISTITLDCGEGVALSETPKEFYIALPPTTFPSGINIDVEFDDGELLPQRTSNSLEIKRNTIQPMATLDFSSNIDWQVATISYDAQSVVAPKVYGSNNISGYLYWGDGTVSVINNATSHTYDDGEATHTLTIKATNATSIEIPNCAGITSLDFSNF